MKDWYDRAACKGLPASIFYPDEEVNAEEGVAICEGCPVKTQCLAHAYQYREKDGTWGGLSQWERKRIRRRASALSVKRRKAEEAQKEGKVQCNEEIIVKSSEEISSGMTQVIGL